MNFRVYLQRKLLTLDLIINRTQVNSDYIGKTYKNTKASFTLLFRRIK